MISLVRAGLLNLIKFYQRWCSPLLGERCRFFPTCSEYASLCLKTHRLTRALLKIVVRLGKCQPLCRGGIDMP